MELRVKIGICGLLTLICFVAFAIVSIPFSIFWDVLCRGLRNPCSFKVGNPQLFHLQNLVDHNLRLIILLVPLHIWMMELFWPTKTATISNWLVNITAWNNKWLTDSVIYWLALLCDKIVIQFCRQYIYT